jgi:hypothetical protein
VQSAAGELEQALHGKGDAAQLEPSRLQFAAVLTPFLDRLRAVLGEDAVAPVASAAAIDPAQMKLLVARMTKHLSESDAAAAECLAENRGAFAALFPAETFVKFEQQVQGYAFDDALAQLQQHCA